MIKKFFLSACLVLLTFSFSNSQIFINFCDDLAYSQINRFYGKNNLTANYSLNKIDFYSGCSFSYLDKNKTFFEGIKIGTKIIPSKNITTLNIDLQYLLKFSSSEIREDNYIIYANYKFKKIELSAGFNNRIFRYKRSIKQDLAADNLDYKVYEPFNFMYLFKLYLNESEKKWNISAAVTDFDDFLIQQEMNPMFYIEGLFYLNENIELYSQFWYKKAGMAHASANNFGSLLRFGILWEI